MAETLRIRRLDTTQTLLVSRSDLRWWLDTQRPTVSYAVTRSEPNQGDVPYLRERPGSQFCVRVQVLPSALPPKPEPSRLASAMRAALRVIPGGEGRGSRG